MRFFRLFALLGALTILYGCGGEDQTVTPDETTPAAPADIPVEVDATNTAKPVDDMSGMVD